MLFVVHATITKTNIMPASISSIAALLHTSSSWVSSYGLLITLLPPAPIWEESHAGAVMQVQALPPRACSLGVKCNAMWKGMGTSKPVRILRLSHAIGGGPIVAEGTKTAMKLAMKTEMSGPAPVLMVAKPEPAGRVPARVTRDAQPMCRQMRRGIITGNQVHRVGAAWALAAGIMSTNTKMPMKEPILATLLNTQRAASNRRMEVQVVELDVTAMPIRYLAARSQARAATGKDAGVGCPRSLGGPSGGAPHGDRRACTRPWCADDGSNNPQENTNPRAPTGHRGNDITECPIGPRGHCPRRPFSRRAQAQPASTW